MSHTPHELIEDFPGAADRIRMLEASDAHFARIVADYHRVNRAVHRAETRVEPVSEQAEAELRLKRARLKTTLQGHLRADPQSIS